jgi:hypothetical protein
MYSKMNYLRIAMTTLALQPASDQHAQELKGAVAAAISTSMFAAWSGDVNQHASSTAEFRNTTGWSPRHE